MEKIKRFYTEVVNGISKTYPMVVTDIRTHYDCLGSLRIDVSGEVYEDGKRTSVYPLGLGIKKVIFNDPATIVYWTDGTKTVVKCQEGDTYSKEVGLAMCMLKKCMGNESSFNNVFKKYCEDDEDER